jgi:hypothetical protein
MPFRKKIIELGFECEIIDYVFPNSSRIVNQNKIYIILRLAKYLIIELILGFPNYTKKKRFAKFYKNITGYLIENMYPLGSLIIIHPFMISLLLEVIRSGTPNI